MFSARNFTQPQSRLNTPIIRVKRIVFCLGGAVRFRDGESDRKYRLSARTSETAFLKIVWNSAGIRRMAGNGAQHRRHEDTIKSNYAKHAVLFFGLCYLSGRTAHPCRRLSLYTSPSLHNTFKLLSTRNTSYANNNSSQSSSS